MVLKGLPESKHGKLAMFVILHCALVTVYLFVAFELHLTLVLLNVDMPYLCKQCRSI